MILSCGWVRKNLVSPLVAHDVPLTPQGRATLRSFTSAATNFELPCNDPQLSLGS